MKSSFKRRGFTLVELLVVIVIIAVLAAVSFTLARKMKDRAMATKSLSDIRQAGNVLLAKASETNGRCQYFSGGAGGFDLRPYFIVMEEMGIIKSRADEMVEIMHWDNGLELQRNPALNPWWACRAVNFTNVPAVNAVWTRVETVPDSQGRKPNVSSLTIGSVTRPGAYPLLIDSSTFSGIEIFRINEGNGDLVGLRSNGKANAVMLDGSARTMDKVDLKAAGFKKAYDNSTTPPKSITL